MCLAFLRHLLLSDLLVDGDLPLERTSAATCCYPSGCVAVVCVVAGLSYRADSTRVPPLVGPSPGAFGGVAWYVVLPRASPHMQFYYENLYVSSF